MTDSPRIRILDETTINQIAAGEVIENPASVVKELVENSLDAGASDICVEIANGGRQLIRISDDGCGMSRDDALLSLERHATSKLRSAEELADIHSMGFRGEAVPSIASISKFTIITSQDGENGSMIVVNGGKQLQCCSAARSKGTTIEVKNLFFNLPVRKKFQRSPTRDASDIRSCLEKLALAHPSVRLELIHNQKREACFHPAQGATELERFGHRVLEVLGKHLYSGTCPIEAEEDGMRLLGYLSVPSYTRPNRTGQTLLLNQRAVQCPAVSFAVRDGYGTRLATQRHPIFVLQLTLPGDLVDVNVHPQKREVRLRQEARIRSFVTHAVELALRRAGVPAAAEPLAMSAAPLAPIRPLSVREPEPLPWDIPAEPAAAAESVATVQDELKFSEPETLAPRVLALQWPYLLLDPASVQLPLPPVAHGQDSGGLMLLDPVAARARVLFEKLLRGEASGALPSQGLLVPHTLELSESELKTVEAMRDVWEASGLQVERFGLRVLAINAVPYFLQADEAEDFIREAISNLEESEAATKMNNMQEGRLATIAQRLAARMPRLKSSEEGQALLEEWARCEDPLHSPKGRPILVLIANHEIKQRFE